LSGSVVTDMKDVSTKPDWWNENQRIRDQYSLPEYQPPRFSDGTYVYEVISKLENDYNCEIQFIGIDTKYAEDWEVRIDGEYVMELPRRIDDNGNMIYEIQPDEFISECKCCVE
jgi:hypothetical protein